MKGFDFPVPAEVERYVLRFKPERSGAIPRPDLFQAWCDYVRAGMGVEDALERVAIDDGRKGKQRVEMLRHLLNATYHLVLDTERGKLIRAYQADKLQAGGAPTRQRDRDPAGARARGQLPEQKGGGLPATALSVRQPFAHLILEGQKTIEWRSRKTHVRGLVMIYAAKTISDDPWVRTHLPELNIKTLPRGLILGQVDIVGCRPIVATDSRLVCASTEEPSGYAWLLANPVRYLKPVAVPSWRQPTPTFWKPFV